MAERDPDRPSTLKRLATARFQAGEHEAAVVGLTEALEALAAVGDDRGVATTKLELARALQWAGRSNWSLVEEATAELERLGPSADLADAVARLAFVHMLADRNAEAVTTADRAIDMASSLGLSAPPAAYAWRGGARGKLGDPAGLEDLRTAVDLATEAGRGRDAANFRNEYSAQLSVFVGNTESMAATEETIAFARSRGLGGVERLALAGRIELLIDAGKLTEAEADALALRLHAAAVGDAFVAPNLTFELATIAWLRGDVARAVLETSGIDADDPDVDVVFLSVAVTNRGAECGRPHC